MIQKIKNILKGNVKILNLAWRLGRYFLLFVGKFVRVNQKSMIFCSLGGRGFNDSPKVIYDAICSDPYFNEWNLIWVFTDPDKMSIPRGKKIKVDTLQFFLTILKTKVWICNSHMDRGFNLRRKENLYVETWHGSPLKKIEGEENKNSLHTKPRRNLRSLDETTIRCAQSAYDQEIFSRIWNASKNSFIMCDLPRNDELTRYTEPQVKSIKSKLKIAEGKKVIFYTPTYREYLVNENNEVYIAPPIDFGKWKRLLGDEYVVMVRAHYAVVESLNLKENDFLKDVSTYSSINDLYAISDMMISDYSSTFIDYSIFERPMFCFAYDFDEYDSLRGFYIDMKTELPCDIDYDEDSLLKHILNLNYEDAITRAKAFHNRFAPNAGHATEAIIKLIKERTKLRPIGQVPQI